MNDDFNVNDEIPNSSEPLNTVIATTQNNPQQYFTAQINLSTVKSISGWGMFRAVIDIISGSFSCLGGIIFFLVGILIFVSGGSSLNDNTTFNFNNSFGDMSSSAAVLVGGLFLFCAVIYPVIGVLRIIYSINLIKAIDNLKKAVALNNESCIIEFLNKLSKFFKFNGIVSILKISLYILLFIFYIVLIIYATSAAPDIMNEFNNNSNNFFQ
jgi:flagellar biosynthesis protein FlhB